MPSATWLLWSLCFGAVDGLPLGVEDFVVKTEYDKSVPKGWSRPKDKFGAHYVYDDMYRHQKDEWDRVNDPDHYTPDWLYEWSSNSSSEAAKNKTFRSWSHPNAGIGPIQLPVLDDADSKTVLTESPNRYEYFAQWAAAAYCPNNINSKGDKIKCSGDICNHVEGENTRTLVEFSKLNSTDLSGFVAIDQTRQIIVAAFSGSEMMKSWLSEQHPNFESTPTYLCKDSPNGLTRGDIIKEEHCRVHKGIWEEWLAIKYTVMPALMSAQKKHPDYGMAAVGHGIGGAIATIAATEVRNRGFRMDLYSFGAPRFSLRSLTRHISVNHDAFYQNFRVTHLSDPIPRMPIARQPPSWQDYRHIWPMAHLFNQNGQPDDLGKKGEHNVEALRPEDEWILRVSREEKWEHEADRIAGYMKQSEWDPAAHDWYFGKINACAPEQSLTYGLLPPSKGNITASDEDVKASATASATTAASTMHHPRPGAPSAYDSVKLPSEINGTTPEKDTKATTAAATTATTTTHRLNAGAASAYRSIPST